MLYIRVFLYSAHSPIVEPKAQTQGTVLTEFNSHTLNVSNISDASVSAVAISLKISPSSSPALGAAPARDTGMETPRGSGARHFAALT